MVTKPRARSHPPRGRQGTPVAVSAAAIFTMASVSSVPSCDSAIKCWVNQGSLDEAILGGLGADTSDTAVICSFSEDTANTTLLSSICSGSSATVVRNLHQEPTGLARHR